RQQNLFRGKLTRKEPEFLPLPHAPHGPGYGFPAALFINYALAGRLQRFPLQQPNPIRVPARQLKPIRQSFRWIIGRRRAPRFSLRYFPPHHLTEQRLLVAEVMVEHSLIDSRAPRDVVHSRASKTFARELLEGRPENSLLRPLRISGSLCNTRHNF